MRITRPSFTAVGTGAGRIGGRLGDHPPSGAVDGVTLAYTGSPEGVGQLGEGTGRHRCRIGPGAPPTVGKLPTPRVVPLLARVVDVGLERPRPPALPVES